MAHTKIPWPPLIPRFSQFSVQSDPSPLSLNGLSELLDASPRRSIASSRGSTVTVGTHLSYKPNLEKMAEEIIRNFLLVPVNNLIDELQLVVHVCSFWAEPQDVTSLEYKSLRQRYEELTSNYVDFRLGTSYSDMDKIQRELAIILSILNALTDEMKQYGSVITGTEYLQNMRYMKQDEDDLFEDLKKKRKLRQTLTQAVSKERHLNHEVLISYESAIVTGFAVVRDETDKTSTEVTYCNKWQKARSDQNLLLLEKKEKTYFDVLLNERLNMVLENQCHEDIEDFIEEWLKEAREKIDSWMKCYETSIEEKENNIYDIKMAIEKMNDKKELMKLQYEDRAQQMEEWLEYKRQKKEEKKLLALQTRAAIKIQTWWKGVMVRKHLGRYKFHSKKGKKGKRQNKKIN